MKKILIKQGHEFKIYTGSNDDLPEEKENLFYQQYEQANFIAQDLIRNFRQRSETSTGNNAEKENRKDREWEYANNIIAFCGERGQGKSSAMYHFTEKYFDNEAAWILRTIDPTALEAAHSIIDIVISRLFECFQSKISQSNREVSQAEKKIIELFQKVHKDMTVLKSEEKFIEREYDYSGSLMRLSEISDSLEMKAALQELIAKMLKLERKEYLVIPLDDLDLNIGSVYKTMEQLRKYLILPRVIIVMAVNIGQLQLCLEREYMKELEALSGTHWDIEHEAKKMADKYLDKLLPFSRRIILPDVRMMTQGGNEGVHIRYLTGEEDKIIDSEELGIESGLLRSI